MLKGRRQEGTDVGTLWTLVGAGARARCALLSRPGEWELRVVVDGAVERARRCGDTREAFAIAERWKRELLAAGWRQLRPTLARASG